MGPCRMSAVCRGGQHVQGAVAQWDTMRQVESHSPALSLIAPRATALPNLVIDPRSLHICRDSRELTTAKRVPVLLEIISFPEKALLLSASVVSSLWMS